MAVIVVRTLNVGHELDAASCTRRAQEGTRTKSVDVLFMWALFEHTPGEALHLCTVLLQAFASSGVLHDSRFKLSPIDSEFHFHFITTCPAPRTHRYQSAVSSPCSYPLVSHPPLSTSSSASLLSRSPERRTQTASSFSLL